MYNFLKKLDIKSWLLIVTSFLAIIFFIIFLTSSSGYKDKIKSLEKDNKKIEIERRNLKAENIILDSKIRIDSIAILKFQQKIDSVQNLILSKDIEIKRLKASAFRAKQELEKTKQQIDSLINNPIKRTGDELLNSIREKTKDI